jgi:hypothetical protein
MYSRLKTASVQKGTLFERDPDGKTTRPADRTSQLQPICRAQRARTSKRGDLPGNRSLAIPGQNRLMKTLDLFTLLLGSDKPAFALRP